MLLCLSVYHEMDNTLFNFFFFIFLEISAVYGSYNKNFLNLYEEIIFRFSLKLYFKMKNGISGFLKVTFYYLNLIKEA